MTTRQNHARDLVAGQDVWRWRAIVIGEGSLADIVVVNMLLLVSGDGLLHEVFNGLFEREDWRVSCQVPVGVIIIIIIIIIIIFIIIITIIIITRWASYQPGRATVWPSPSPGSVASPSGGAWSHRWGECRVCRLC